MIPVSISNAAPPPTPARVPAMARDVLRAALPSTVDMLHRRRARDIPEGYIDAFVALHWLEWHGGGLRVTTTGENVCRQMVYRMAPDASGAAIV
jgi:hypothetical protein